MSTSLDDLLVQLRRPFHPSQVSWKPGAIKGDRALALAYADLRAYMNRLDEVCGSEWSVSYEPWGEDRIICRLTIMGITRSSTGESDSDSERSEIGGTVAEAMAYKRACAMFGLGRYLYNLPTGWADFDPATKRFTEKAKAKLMGLLVQQYRRATDSKAEMAEVFAATEDATDTDSDDSEGKVVDEQLETLIEQFDKLGRELYGNQWPQVCQRNCSRISSGKAQKVGELTHEQVQKLIDGMIKLKSNRTPMASNGIAH